MRDFFEGLTHSVKFRLGKVISNYTPMNCVGNHFHEKNDPPLVPLVVPAPDELFLLTSILLYTSSFLRGVAMSLDVCPLIAGKVPVVILLDGNTVGP